MQNNNNNQETKTFKTIEHHAIRLPKGGGAIRGIGEKFQANPVTGSGSFSIPLPVSPGRGGFQPDLSLSYNSGSGNSEFGLGWGIGVPSITRKTDKELPQYLDSDNFESDTFLLAGAEDLIPVLKKIGSKWSRVKKNAVDMKNSIEHTYTVYPYRPRIEGLFANIEKWIDDDTRDIHWRITTKENITSFYGESDQARVRDQNDSSKVYEWLIEKSFDAKGNCIVYEYKKENHQNIPDSLSERMRVKNNSGFTKRYLKRIKYSPFADNPERFHFQVLFDYGEHTSDSPDEVAQWQGRLDPLSAYKAGFEIRCYRLCRRVLMFHNFPKGNSDSWELVKSLDLAYEMSDILTYLSSATIKGFKKTESGYSVKSIPNMEFTYTRPVPGSEIKKLDKESLHNLPIGIDDSAYQWIDLAGEGISGILSRQGSSIYYKENLGNGRFSSMKPVSSPTAIAIDKPVYITDVNGDGVNELVVRNEQVNGYYSYSGNQWESFVSFKKNPVVDWSDSNLKMIDLSGDGHPDIMITEDHIFRWYPSVGKEGYDTSRTISKPKDELQGPALVFNDPTESIYLADMSGDGLTDIVRIRNGEVCYWPNLGYGRFGAKVFMSNPPKFVASREKFNPKYIKLGDIDGSGTTDIMYLGNGMPKYYFNRAGNGWSDANGVNFSLPVDSLSSVSLVDILGTGTMCLVWSSQRPGMREKQMSYIDLMSIKPHLLSEVRDNMGSVVRLTYVSSTKFYLDDKKKGTPWITRFSFPVHCLERVETIDEISGSKLVTQYAYHHGFFDGLEREFRGFGMVETIDTETFEEYSGDPKQYVAPILTKTWYHTGAFIKAGIISKQYEQEYYQGDNKAFLLPDTVIEGIEDMNAQEVREAYRTLKGSALRQEVYEAGKDVPYQVQEANFSVRMLQGLGQNKYGVFFVHANEAITFHYEQDKDDSRIAHEFTLEIDDYGNIKKSMNLVYPRRFGTGVLPEQLKAYTTLTVKEYINETTGFYRVGLPVEESVYELCGNMGVDAYKQLFLKEAVLFAEAGLLNIVLPGCPLNPLGGDLIEARLVSQGRQFFWNEEQDAVLPFGQITDKVLVHHTETASLTQDLVNKAYGTQVTDVMLVSAGYIFHDNIYYNPGLVQSYSIRNFYLPTETRDPFGGFVQVAYDSFYMFPIKTEDALGNISSALMDYRTLSPWRLIDANGNVSEAMSDEMGMVMVTSVYGSEENQLKGDMPLFDNEGNPIYSTLNPPEGDLGNGIFDDILQNPDKYLQNATTYFYYDLDSWKREQKPLHFIELARETHVRDLAVGESTRIRKTIGFSDGFEREIQTKVQVEPGLAWIKSTPPVSPPSLGEEFKEEFTEDRWLVSGRTVYNNKQKPVKQYEPFYSAKVDYEDEEFFASHGVTPVLHYDPLLRIVRTDTPKGFFSKVTFTPWEVWTYDENDTVKDSEYYAKYVTLPPEEQEALDKAALHYNTPKITRLDTLGREFMRIEYKIDVNELTDQNRVENELITYTEFTITGKPKTIADPRQYSSLNPLKRNYIYIYDMADQIIRTQHIDGGDDKVLFNVLTNLILSMDAKGHVFMISYDLLQRPISKTVTGNELNGIVEQLIYGETVPYTEQYNLRGMLYRHYDQAGRITTSLYSFKGEPITVERKMRSEYKDEADWQEGADWDSLLDKESYTITTRYDALGKIKEQENPDSSIIKPVYHLSGNLDKVTAKLKGETVFSQFVTGITYNPKGQRENISYGNGTTTSYTYEKETFRLTSLVTTRNSDNKKLQDISYTYDPVGNITLINDASIATVFNNNQMVEPKQKYLYDALYRLIEAEGREHTALNNPDYYKDPNAFKQSAFIHISDINDSNKLANYTRRYTYDNGGNLTKIQHIAANSQRSYTREISIDEQSNRWLPKNMGNDLTFDDYYDRNGNIIKLEHLEKIVWNYRDNISSAVLLQRPSGQDDAEFYVYDSTGQRVRKVRETLRTGDVVEIEEKIYLGAVEIKKIRVNTTQELSRSTLHIMDDKKRIGIVHNWLMDMNNREINDQSELNTNKTRYQYGNHLDSTSLELDPVGRIISYEETPSYGETTFIAGTNAKEVKLKEYRYTGKERDDATGLYYYGARYYACWVGRWLSCDPLFRENPAVYEKSKPVNQDEKKKQEEEFEGKLYSEGLNLYCYVMNNPVRNIDPQGTDKLDDFLNAVIRTNKELWEYNNQYHSQKFSEAKDPVSAVYHGASSLFSKGADFLSPENLNKLREWLFTGGMLNEPAKAAGQSLEYLGSKFINTKAGQKTLKLTDDIIKYFSSKINAGQVAKGGRNIPGIPGQVSGGSSTNLGRNMMEAMGLPRTTSWTGYEAQHIIPVDMGSHPVLRKIGMNLDDATNGIFLRIPDNSTSAMARHKGFHSVYNRVVARALNRMNINSSVSVLENQVFRLQQKLRYLQSQGMPLYEKFGASIDLWERWLNKIK